jgi:hypothetical protein
MSNGLLRIENLAAANFFHVSQIANRNSTKKRQKTACVDTQQRLENCTAKEYQSKQTRP